MGFGIQWTNEAKEIRSEEGRAFEDARMVGISQNRCQEQTVVCYGNSDSRATAELGYVVCLPANLDERAHASWTESTPCRLIAWQSGSGCIWGRRAGRRTLSSAQGRSALTRSRFFRRARGCGARLRWIRRRQ